MSPEKVIPVPLASHDDIVTDPTLFSNTLRSFHFALGSKFLVPVIGGKELNLHVLYVEVTRRGGYDKVVAEKKWREISAVFDFSPTTTSASYALRKHYFTLLHPYEQLYFFRTHPSLLHHSDCCHLVMLHFALTDKKRSAYIFVLGPPSFEAIGTIDAKFDCGYLISVKLGNETLNGVLYHPSDPGNVATAQPTCNALVPYTPQLHQPSRRTRRRRSGDPGRPKPNRSGYNFFFAERHSMLKSLYPNREREFTKMIGQSWNSLSPEERVVYQNHGLKDKERYQRELKEYKERLNLGQPCKI